MKDQETNYKECPYCGQKEVPFKLGVCICGKQVGGIIYVENAARYARTRFPYYGYIGDYTSW